MPELPDLTVFAESLTQLVGGKKVTDARYHRRSRLNVDPAQLRETLIGQRVVGVRREAKGLLFSLDRGDRLFVHLMLSGGFQRTPPGEEVAYAVLTLSFDDGHALALFDPRGLATVTLNPKSGKSVLDALQVTEESLRDILLSKPKLTVKECLIDQSLISGIGNAYSDEILWQARVAPKSLAGRLPEQVIAQLARAIPTVLNEATEYLRRQHAGMIAGEFREHLAVHKPKARQAPTGAPIKNEMVGQKKTYYTEEQVLYE
ncbi:formamidopyrimidine-DNA glycosylase [Geomonas limicola]|uniref:Formamidopyrimidine-DNA glycosylase n=1 Tax=Geomonas limicola TaxID=2740186 RepID=A0A6V8N649_9BACT|nr:DNA-formamidopyrimidine glycosylase family protein [Geomonas limicola]GFO67043.1 formamidopyrimidine-DNA glycosylase [Geomonas limicola]